MKHNMEFKMLKVFFRSLEVPFDANTINFFLGKEYNKQYITKTLKKLAGIDYLTIQNKGLGVYIMYKENMVKIIKTNPELAIEIMVEAMNK